MNLDKLRHLALNMLCTDYITPRDMELELAKGFLKISAVVESAKKLASYVEECYPGLYVTDQIRADLKELEID